MGWHPKTVVGRLIHVIVFVPWAVAHAILTVVGFLSILAIALGLMLAALPVLGLIVLVLYVKGGNPQNSNL